MSWRDSLSGYPYAPPTPGLPFYAESIRSYLSGLQGFPPAGGIQQFGVSGYPAAGSYLPALSREATSRGAILPPSSVLNSTSPTLASGLLQATARSLSTSEASSLYGSLLLEATSAANGQSVRSAPHRLPPPPPLKQAPRKKAGASSLPRWHHAVASSVHPTSYSWHKPVTSSSSTAKRTSPEACDTMDDDDARSYRRVGDKFSCLQCSYTSSKAEKMRQHIRAHAGGKICKICGKAFVKQCDLTRHVHAHNKDLFHIWDPLSTDVIPPRLDHMAIPDEAAAHIPASFDSCTPAAVGSSASYDVPSTTEPSEAIFRVLRPVAAQLRHAASLMPLLERCPASLQDGDEHGRTTEVEGQDTSVKQTENNESCTGNGAEELAGAHHLGEKAYVTGPKSILQEILSDIVQNERKAVQDGYASNDGPEEKGISNDNNNTGGYLSKGDPVTETGQAPSLYQAKPVTDTDILLALYGENLKKTPTDNRDDTSAVRTKTDETKENTGNSDSVALTCTDRNESGAGQNDEDDADEDDDDDDDEDDDDDDDDDVLCIAANEQTEMDADESTVDSCFTEKGKISAPTTDISGPSGAERDVPQIRRTGEIRSENNKQCDSSNETGQSSTDVDSILDSAITLPEYASVGGSIVDLSMHESHSVDQSVERASFMPLGLDPALVGLHGSPEGAVSRTGSQSPRLRGSSGFRCSICNYEGRSEKSLQKHIRAHSSSYKICRYCSKAFERPSDLARHEERHERNMAKTGGDPSLISKGQILGIGTPDVVAPSPAPPCQEFRCKRCDFVTNRYHKLALHKRQKHSAKHCCKYCPMFFISALPLSNHMKRCPMKPREGVGESTAPETEVISSEEGKETATPLSGVGRLDSFRKDVLFRSVLVGVELGPDNDLIISTGDVVDELIDHVADDVPNCADTNQARVLRASRLCTAESCDVQARTTGSGSPVKIDLTSSPSPPVLERSCDVSRMSPKPSAEYSLLANILSQDSTSPASGTPAPVSGCNHPVSSANGAGCSDTKTTISGDPDDGVVPQSRCSVLQAEVTPVQSESKAASKTGTNVTDSPSNPTELLDLVLRPTPTTGTTTTSTTATLITAVTAATTTMSPEQHVTEDKVEEYSAVAPKSLREILMADYSYSAAAMSTALATQATASATALSTALATQGASNSSSEILALSVDTEGVKSATSKYPILGEQLGKPTIKLAMVGVNAGGMDADGRATGDRAVTPTALTTENAELPSIRRSSSGQVTRRKALRHRIARYYCQRCNYGTDMKTKMEKHMKAHGGRFICKHCNKACIKASDLYRHWVTHNVKNDSGEYLCDSCEFSSPSKHVVMNHLRVHYLIKRTPFPESHNVTRCGLCGKTFSRSQLFVHKRMVHGVGAKQSTPVAEKFGEDNRAEDHTRADRGAEVPDSGDSKKQVFRCAACNKEFESQTRVNSHYEQSHLRENGSGASGRSDFECGECSRSFSSKRQLVCHQRCHYASAKGRHNVRVHHQLSNNSHRKKYRCPYCGKRFRGRYYLAHHTKLHTGEKPYQCMRCGEKFALSQACQNHIKRGCPVRRERRHVMITSDQETKTGVDGEEDATRTVPSPSIEIIND